MRRGNSEYTKDIITLLKEINIFRHIAAREFKPSPRVMKIINAINKGRALDKLES